MKNEAEAMNFWGRTELLLSQHQMTLKSLCDRTGLNYRSMLNMKSKARLPNITAGVAMARILGTTVEWLLLGSIELPQKEKILQDTIDLCRENAEVYSVVTQIPKASTKNLKVIKLLLQDGN